MRRFARNTLMLLCLSAISERGRADDEPYKATLEYEALARDFQITKVIEADTDGDGAKEVLLAFRDNAEERYPGGGVVELKIGKGGVGQSACLFMEDRYPVDIEANGKDITIKVVDSRRGADPEPLIIRHGELLRVRGAAGDPFSDVKATASSTLKGTSTAALFDQKLTTSWAEGGGTGIGETLTIEFKKPVGVGLMAVLPGKSTDLREFKDHNRVHRIILDVTNASNAGDPSVGLDFADLGIVGGGRETEVTFANRPEVKYVRIVEEEAIKVNIKIDSVYLGDKKDEAHVAEIWFCPLVSDREVKEAIKAQKKQAPAVKAQ